jgi:hypothetical protein
MPASWCRTPIALQSLLRLPPAGSACFSAPTIDPIDTPIHPHYAVAVLKILSTTADDDDRAEVQAKLDAGATVVQAAALGVSQSTVYRLLRARKAS